MRPLALLATVALAGPAAAAATPYRDPGSGFAVDIDFPGADVCTIKPERTPVASECQGIDVPRARAGLARETHYMGVVRRPDGSGAVLNVIFTLRMNTANVPFSIEDAAAWRQRAVREMDRRFPGATLLAPMDEQLVNGLQLFRFAVAMQTTPFDVVLNYVLIGREELVQVQLVGTRAELPWLIERGDAMVKRATMPDAVTPAQWRTRADEDRARIVGIVRPIGELIALCVGAILLYRWVRLRRRRSGLP